MSMSETHALRILLPPLQPHVPPAPPGPREAPKGSPTSLGGQSWETGQSSPRRSMRSASTRTGTRRGHGRTTAQVLRATGLPPTERRLLRMGADLPGDGQLLRERPVLGNRSGRAIRRPGRQRHLRHRRLKDCWPREAPRRLRRTGPIRLRRDAPNVRRLDA